MAHPGHILGRPLISCNILNVSLLRGGSFVLATDLLCDRGRNLPIRLATRPNLKSCHDSGTVANSEGPHGLDVDSVCCLGGVQCDCLHGYVADHSIEECGREEYRTCGLVQVQGEW